MIYLNLLLIILAIIFIHELGHYFFARVFKTKVTDFSIGFGKSLFQFKDKNLTNWKISLIPLGGYVKIKGLESIFNENKNIQQDKDSFQFLSLNKKIIILLAGSFFNILSSWFALFCIFFFFGIVYFSPEIGKIIDNSPADFNNLREGDLIIKVDDISIDNFSDIGKAILNKEIIKLEILRNNKIISKEIKLKFNQEMNRYIIGITSNDVPKIEKYNFLKSFNQSVLFIPKYYSEIFKYILNSYSNNTLSSEVAGPIGMIKMADKLMLDKMNGILFIFISISLFVAIFNLLPIPLLDGGHIVYFIIRKVFSDSLPNYVTRIYLITGITIMAFLFFVITYNDIFYK